MSYRILLFKRLKSEAEASLRCRQTKSEKEFKIDVISWWFAIRICVALRRSD